MFLGCVDSTRHLSWDECPLKPHLTQWGFSSAKAAASHETHYFKKKKKTHSLTRTFTHIGERQRSHGSADLHSMQPKRSLSNICHQFVTVSRAVASHIWTLINLCNDAESKRHYRPPDQKGELSSALLNPFQSQFSSFLFFKFQHCFQTRNWWLPIISLLKYCLHYARAHFNPFLFFSIFIPLKYTTSVSVTISSSLPSTSK